MKLLKVVDASKPYDRLVTMVVMVEAAEPPDAEEVASKAGYNSVGYGCYDPKVEGIPDQPGVWRVTWRRGKSCE